MVIRTFITASRRHGGAAIGGEYANPTNADILFDSGLYVDPSLPTPNSAFAGSVTAGSGGRGGDGVDGGMGGAGGDASTYGAGQLTDGAESTFVHEIGHTQGRYHVLCSGGEAGADAALRRVAHFAKIPVTLPSLATRSCSAAP